MATSGTSPRATDSVELADLPDHARPGALIAGKYRVDWVLGLGPTTILRATHTVLDVPVMIEILDADRAQDEQEVAHFVDQARAAMKGSERPRVMDVDRLPSGEPYRVVDAAKLPDGEQYARERGASSFATHAVDETIRACLTLLAPPPNDGLRPATVGAEGAHVRTQVAGWTKGPSQRTAPAAATPGELATPATQARWLLVRLFRSLAGKSPFEGANETDLIARVLTTEPRKLAVERPDLDPDLVRALDDGIAAAEGQGWASPIELVAALAPHASAEVQSLARQAAGGPRGPTATAVPGSKPRERARSAALLERTAPAVRRSVALPVATPEDHRITAASPIPMNRPPWTTGVVVALALAGGLLLVRWLAAGADHAPAPVGGETTVASSPPAPLASAAPSAPATTSAGPLSGGTSAAAPSLAHPPALEATRSEIATTARPPLAARSAPTTAPSPRSSEVPSASYVDYGGRK